MSTSITIDDGIVYSFRKLKVSRCRTRVVANVYDPKNQIIPGRGNLYPLIVNLPYIALEAKREYDQLQTHDTTFEEYFIGKLDRYQDECFDLLIDKLNYISRKKAKNFPFLMGNHLYVGSEHFTPESEIGPAIRNGTLTTGFIGLAECLVVLTGKHHGESDAAQELGLSIIKHMYDRCVAKSQEMQLNFTLMGAPAEGAAGRLLRCTRKEFGIIPGVTDHEFLTNSHHIPVYYKISFIDKVLKEAPYHKYEPAGGISYIELSSDTAQNVEAFQQMVEFMADNDMGYFSINHPVDRDPVCGYTGIIPLGGTCPRCGRKENEGVAASKLLSLTTYSPDPEYAIPYDTVDVRDETLTNDIETH